MSPAGIRALSAGEIAARVRRGDLTALRVAEAFLDRSRAVEGSVRAFLYLRDDEVRAAAAALDEKRSRGHPLGVLAGVPVAIKDNLTTAAAPTTCASRILAGHRPLRDATAVARLLRADAIVFGKTNLDEFAMGSSTEYSAFHPTHNPWDPGCVPGGSSGGSAAAVASGQVPLALGSDTGGSVRQPAAFCGLVGLKPQYGRVSRSGLVAFASSLDTVGVLARTSRDAALLLRVIEGPDEADATSLRGAPATGMPSGPAGPAATDLPGLPAYPLRGVRIGIPRRLPARGVDACVLDVFEETVRRFSLLGAEMNEIPLDPWDPALAAYYVIADAEASSNLARYDGLRFGRPGGEENPDGEENPEELYARVRGEGFGAEVKRRILLGTFVLSHGYREAYYARAQRVRARISHALEHALLDLDALLLPTAPSPAFPLGAKREDPIAMYFSDVFTLPANLAEIPAVSFPAGISAGLPVGMQLYGRRNGESRLLGLVRAWEAASDGRGSVESDARSPARAFFGGGV